MKKILLLLIILYTFAFSYEFPSVVVSNGTTYYFNKIVYQGRESASGPCSSNTGVDINNQGNYIYYSLKYDCTSTYNGYNYNTSFSQVNALFDINRHCSSDQTIVIDGVCTNPTPTCSSTQELIDGVCVDKCPSGQDRFNGTCVDACNQMMGEFRKQDGSCQDCASHTNFSSKAFCACDSQDTTYTPQAVVSTIYNNGNYTYNKTNITCDNGLRIALYTDPKNINPQDYNKTLNTDGTVSNTDPNTTPNPDANATIAPPVTNTTNDVVDTIKATSDQVQQAVKSIEKGQKDSTTALKEVGVDIKAVNAELAKHGTTFNEILTKINEGNAKGDARFKLMDDEFKGQVQYRNMMGKWVNDDMLNASNQLSATRDIKQAVDGASTAITSKLDEVITAIKDSNGSGQEIDLNATNSKLDTLHDDNNKTHGLLDKLVAFFDTNNSVPDANMSGQDFELSDLLPDAAFFETNKLNLNFNNYHGECYLQTTTFSIGGTEFVFPPPGLMAMIPFSTISNMLMAFLFLLGLRDFLRS